MLLKLDAVGGVKSKIKGDVDYINSTPLTLKMFPVVVYHQREKKFRAVAVEVVQ